MPRGSWRRGLAIDLFALWQPTAGLFSPEREQKNAQHNKSVVSLKGINRHRTTSSVCSSVISPGVAVVGGMSVVCDESLVFVRLAFVCGFWCFAGGLESAPETSRAQPPVM